MGMNSLAGGTSMDAAEDMLRTLERLQQSEFRRRLPPDSLAIDFPQRSPLGQRALKLTAEEGSKTLGIMSEPEEVLMKMDEIRAESRSRLASIGLVLVNYVLHDVPGIHRAEFLRQIASRCPNALFIVADYTMLNMSQMDAEKLFTADLEMRRIQEKTRSVYLEEHLQFTYESLCALMMTQFRDVRGHKLPAGRALIGGSNSLFNWSTDIQEDWSEEQMPNPIDVYVDPNPTNARSVSPVSIST